MAADRAIGQGGTCAAPQERTGSSNRRWLSKQTGLISSGVTRNSGAPGQPSRALPFQLTVPGPSHIPLPSSLFSSLWLCPAVLPLYHSYVSGVGVSRLTFFNIWRGGPPGRRTNRPTWQMPGCLLRPCCSSISWRRVTPRLRNRSILYICWCIANVLYWLIRYRLMKSHLNKLEFSACCELIWCDRDTD